MSLTLKIFGGTTTDDHKCVRCEYAHVMKDSNNRETIRCRVFGREIAERIVECNRFRATGFELENFKLASLAYIIDKDHNGNVTIYRPDRKIAFSTVKRKRRTRVSRRTLVVPVAVQ